MTLASSLRDSAAVRLTSVYLHGDSERIRLVGEAESAGNRFELYFQYPVEYQSFVCESADPFAVAMLIPAMLRGEPLEVGPAISPVLHRELPRIRDIFWTWFPTLARSEIYTTPRPDSPLERPPRAATCFSAGVDSFYTLLKYRGRDALPSPLTHIVFMRGLEKPLSFLRGVEEAEQLVGRIAAQVGVGCIVGESNLRTHFDADWLNLYSGSALAAAGLSLAGGFSHFCIPAAFSYRTVVPTSTTPLVDERYSTEHLTIVHEGAELTRAEKVARILEWDAPLVLDHLRVCVMNRGGAYNCCECRKCVRTMISLRIVGALDRANTFPNRSTSHWDRVASQDNLIFLDENLQLARDRGKDPAFTAWLERLVARRKRKDAARELLLNSPLHGLVPVIQAIRRRLWGAAEPRTLTDA